MCQLFGGLSLCRVEYLIVKCLFDQLLFTRGIDSLLLYFTITYFRAVGALYSFGISVCLL